MVLEALEKILDINFQPDINIQNVSLIDIDGGDKLRKEGQTLKVNIGDLSPEERRELLDVPPDQFEVQERVLNEDEEKETSAIEAGFDDVKKDILDYFDGVLSEQYYSIVEDSLYLRGLIEEEGLSKEEINKRKRDFAKKHGPDAYYLSSLVTAGYFDRDGGVRDIYVDMELNDQYDRYKFQDRLEELVKAKLLCVFVENDDSISEVTREVESRLALYQREDPVNSWLDLRGIGDGCQQIIDGVMDNLGDEYIGIDYDEWANGDDLHVRIHPHSLPDIAG